MSQDIYVVAEHLKGQLDDVTFELLGKGRELASASGGQLVALLFGSGLQDAASQLGAADKVIMVDHPSLADFNPETYATALGHVLAQKPARLTLVANTSMGMDLAAAVSVKNNLPLVAYATDVKFEDGTAVAVSQLYGGKINVESAIEGDSGIVSVLAGSFPADAGRKEGAPAVETMDLPEAGGKVRFKALIEPEGGDVDITQQDVLVSVGRGIQSEDNLGMVEELANALGGAVSSSRPIVDNKWLPKTRQVGKSGLKVKPKLYFAVGISGAPEHIEGMKDAELIIAVNTDPEAPIFEYAHYGTTEDLFDVVPALTEKLKG
ncbi:MAG: electron transfer flavoprotein subunit alpha/FixB family protein [Calditrichaeota bacterium]|nr:MAG: electron transfer flavoprotein subunit alpha/FixB family protein [Calditrichota bacterium]